MFGPGAAFEGRIDGFARLHPSVENNLIVQNLQHLGEPGDVAGDFLPVLLKHFTALGQGSRAQGTQFRIPLPVPDPHAGCLEAVEKRDPAQGGRVIDPPPASIARRARDQADLLVVAQRVG